MSIPMDENQQLVKTLRKTKVAVIHAADENRKNLILQLKRIGCQVEPVWPIPQLINPDIDAIFFPINPETQSFLVPLCDKRQAAVIALIEFENPLTLQTIADANVNGILFKPIRPSGVLTCLVNALASFRYEMRLQARISKLDEMLKTRRIVEQAAKILVQYKGLTNDEAHSLLRQEAMNKKITLHEMATAIVNADTVLLHT
ncbi:MAG: ANTAR domain-containing protein [Pseudomonadota bacterium]